MASNQIDNCSDTKQMEKRESVTVIIKSIILYNRYHGK